MTFKTHFTFILQNPELNKTFRCKIISLALLSSKISLAFKSDYFEHKRLEKCFDSPQNIIPRYFSLHNCVHIHCLGCVFHFPSLVSFVLHLKHICVCEIHFIWKADWRMERGREGERERQNMYESFIHSQNALNSPE